MKPEHFDWNLSGQSGTDWDLKSNKLISIYFIFKINTKWKECNKYYYEWKFVRRGEFNEDEFSIWPCQKNRLGSINLLLLLLFCLIFFIFRLIKDGFVVENRVINIYMVFLGFVLVKISWSLGLI
jgi:hypothetical protein